MPEQQSNQQYLQQATLTAHKKAEKKRIFVDMLSGNICLEQYLAVLEAWRFIIATVNRQTCGFLDDDSAQSLQWLSKDLTRHQTGNVPSFHSTCPPIEHAHQAWGYAYVLNGAQLGNRIFYKALKASAHSADWPSAFYAGRGQETSQHWQVFSQRLNAQRFNPREKREAAKSANDVFNLVDSVFEELETMAAA